VEAETIVEVRLDASGRSRLHRARCEAPLLVRESIDDDGALVLLLVNAAAGPLGGDRLSFVLTVDAGALVRVRSVAASMAQPGARTGRSWSSIRLGLGEGASLDWRTEPVISVVGSDHESTILVEADADAELRLVETVSLGREGEPTGRLSLHQRVLVGGRPVLDHRTEFAPGPLLGAGAQGGGRGFRSVLHVGANAPTAARTSVSPDGAEGVFPLSPGCALAVARARDIAALPPI
jgi:urease accessory protein